MPYYKEKNCYLYIYLKPVEPILKITLNTILRKHYLAVKLIHC